MGMQAYVISDFEPTTQRIRDAMLRAGIDCPAQGVLVLDLAAEQLAQARPDLIVLAMTPDPERALAVLGQLRSLNSGPVLVVGPTADTRFVLRALRGGADDFVDEA